MAQQPSLSPSAALARHWRSGELLRPHLAHGNDYIGRNIQAACRQPDRLRVRRFIQAIGLTFVGAQKRIQPLNPDLVVDLPDLRGRRVVEHHFFGEFPLYQE